MMMTKNSVIKIGDRIGSITVLDDRMYRYQTISRITGRPIIYNRRKCVCDCGKIMYIQDRQLLDHLSTNKKFKCLECYKAKDCIKSVVRRIKSDINRRDTVHVITLMDDQIAKIIQNNCFYCGAKPVINFRGRGIIYHNGIDRLDSNKGYTQLNSVPCCPTCNFMKRNKLFDDFLDHIKTIYENLELQNLSKLKEVA